jgi:transposase
MAKTKRNVKDTILRKHCCLNPEPESVTDNHFVSDDFFDPRDLLQVKYEMLRKAKIEKIPVSKSAADFGFSRVTFYQTQKAFDTLGLVGLISKKRGPKDRHKLDQEIMNFVNELKQKKINIKEIAERINETFKLRVHPRSIQRALAAQKKKRDTQESSTFTKHTQNDNPTI